jgi:hypothetical protein
MLLVLTVLAVAAGLTWPSIARIYALQQIREGAEMVQVRLAAARVRALESGAVYQFRYEPGGHRFVVIPYEAEVLAASSSGAAGAPPRYAGTLPNSVTFDQSSLGGSGQQIPESWLAGLPNAGAFHQAVLSGPLLFFPDGTSGDFELLVNGPRQQQMKLSVRGLTGGVTLANVQRGPGQ